MRDSEIKMAVLRALRLQNAISTDEAAAQFHRRSQAIEIMSTLLHLARAGSAEAAFEHGQLCSTPAIQRLGLGGREQASLSFELAWQLGYWESSENESYEDDTVWIGQAAL